MSQLALALACTVAMLAACAEGGTVSIEQWSNPDCSGMREYGEEYDLSSDGTCLQSTGLSIVPYSKYSCSDDGTKISMPAYSDANCADEIDMNSPAWCSRLVDTVIESCTFPPHMTFVSGQCTQVGRGLFSLSWKVTITDCAGGSWTDGWQWAVVSVGVLIGCCNRLGRAGRPPNSSNVRCSPPLRPLSRQLTMSPFQMQTEMLAQHQPQVVHAVASPLAQNQPQVVHAVASPL
jgi:hypothetical protein